MKIVVVGSGLAGITVAEALASQAPFHVTLVTAETQGHYARPRLSHGMSLSDEEVQKIVLKPIRALAPSLNVLIGTADRIDRKAQELTMASGDELAYDALILATGSAARIPPALASCRDAFSTLNSFDDLLVLRRRAAQTRARSGQVRWAIVGGGLIGCELASDLHRTGDSVTIFHRAPRLMELQLTPGQSEALHSHFAECGIGVRVNQDLNSPPEGFNQVIVCTGFAPRVDLAKAAGLTTNRGIAVDLRLRTDDSNIYAVGDVAEVNGKLYPFVVPIRSQAIWLADHLTGRSQTTWVPPVFTPIIKVHGFKVPKS